MKTYLTQSKAKKEEENFIEITWTSPRLCKRNVSEFDREKITSWTKVEVVDRKNPKKMDRHSNPSRYSYSGSYDK